MCPDELVLFISTLAITIAKDKSTDEIDLLSVIFSQLGDTLATISTSRQRCENKESSKPEAPDCCEEPVCCEPPVCCESPIC